MLRNKKHCFYKVLLVFFCVGVLAILLGESIFRQATQNYLSLLYVYARKNEINTMQVAELASVIADRWTQDAELSRTAGISFLACNQGGKALRYLRNAHIIDPDNSLNLYWLGKAYEQTGDYESALVTMYQFGDGDYFPILPDTITASTLEQLAQNLVGKPISAQAHIELAKRVYDINSNLTEEHFENAIQTKPKEVGYFLTAAWFYFDQGDWETASAYGYRAQSIDTDSAWVYVFWGAYHRANEDTEQAIADFERVLLLSPSPNAKNTAHVTLGGLYREQGEYDTALKHLTLAEQVNGEQLSVYLHRSQILMEIGACESALQQLDLAWSLVLTEQQQALYTRYEQLVRQGCQ